MAIVTVGYRKYKQKSYQTANPNFPAFLGLSGAWFCERAKRPDTLSQTHEVIQQKKQSSNRDSNKQMLEWTPRGRFYMPSQTDATATLAATKSPLDCAKVVMAPVAADVPSAAVVPLARVPLM